MTARLSRVRRAWLALLSPIVLSLIACGSSDSAQSSASMNAPRDGGSGAFDGTPADQRDEDSRTVAPDAPDEAPSPAPDGSDDADDADAFDRDATPNPDGAHPVSQYCGDAIRDPVTEECDDGTGEGACTADCRVRPVRLVEAGRNDALRPGGPRRRLATGRHVIAAGSDGFAAVYVEDDPDVRVMLQPFDAGGTRSTDPIDVSAGSFRPAATDPSSVVAALPDGGYAVAWSGHNPPRVVLHAVSADGTIDDGRTVSAPTSGPKTQPDMVWTGLELVMGWTDGFDVVRPDVKLRRFDAELAPIDEEITLGGRELEGEKPAESHLALTPFAEGWAAAWRAVVVGLEVVRARAGEVSWETERHPPAISGDRPALVELDEEHLLLVFTARPEPGDAGASAAQHLRIAALDVTAPGTTLSTPLPLLTEPYASDPSLAQSRPDAVRVGDRIFIAWQSESPDADGEQVWLQQIAWSPEAPDTIEAVNEWRLPVTGAHAPAQQRPALGASQLFPEGALITAWEDHSGANEDRPAADLRLSFRPVPFVVLGEDGGPMPVM